MRRSGGGNDADPKAHGWAILRNRRFELMQPMFGRYVFVGFDFSSFRWQRVNYTSGVIHLLPKHLEEALALPEQFIPELQAREAEAEVARLAAAEELCARFAPHEVVRILRGGLAGQQAEVIVSDQRQTRVSVQFLGRVTTATVATDDLESAEPDGAL